MIADGDCRGGRGSGLFDEMRREEMSSEEMNEELQSAPVSADGSSGLYYGPVYLPRNSGTKVGEFRFLVDLAGGREVAIGTPVTAETAEGNFVGVVVDMQTIGDDRDPLATDMAGGNVIGKLTEVMVATCQVFHSEALRPVRAGQVRAATAAEILRATGYEKIDYPIPAGCVAAGGGIDVPVYFDGMALLGPEAAHLMVSGLSGQAAKTSYMGVLLASIMAQDPKKTGETVSALVFNVKGEDMLYLDQKPQAGYELTPEDLAMYEALGVPAEPFGDVTVYAPPLAGSELTSSARSEGTQKLCWDLASIWSYLGYFFNTYDDEKLASFLAEYRDEYIQSADPTKRFYRTFAGMDRFFEEALTIDEDTGQPRGWRSHHPATLRRIRRMIGALPARCRGLLTRETSEMADDIPTNQWTHGQVVVIDIAGLVPEAQSLVIARTCERMLREAEEGDLGVDHLVILTDELNVFAAQGATPLTGVRKILQRISTQGRYAGISLFGAAQKLSKVDELTRDNAATRAMGITPDAELASGVYGRMQAGLAEQIATLGRGQMALSHHSFRAPLVVRFPRPAWRTGRAKTRRAKPKLSEMLGLDRRRYDLLTEGLTEDAAEKLMADATPEEARARLEKARVPDMNRVVVHEPYQTDPEDPYGEEGPELGEGFTNPYAVGEES